MKPSEADSFDGRSCQPHTDGADFEIAVGVLRVLNYKTDATTCKLTGFSFFVDQERQC